VNRRSRITGNTVIFIGPQAIKQAQRESSRSVPEAAR
jgi:hypothetical protein